MSAASCEGSDETQIKSVLIKERYYRDTSQFEKMRDTYHPDGSRTWVNISWYDGDIDGFINGTRAVTQNKINTIHILAPADITIEGSKALSESFCEITSRFEHGGYEFDKVTTCRLISTLEKLDLNAFEKKSASRNPWKILTLEPIYIRDSIVPANPSFIEKPPRFEGLEKFPKSYCHGAWLLDKIQITSRLDLPSEDNHEAVKAIFDRHHKWLYSA